MIIQKVLQDPLLAESFDFVNDYRDTMDWLRSLKPQDLHSRQARKLLEHRRGLWLRKQRKFAEQAAGRTVRGQADD